MTEATADASLEPPLAQFGFGHRLAAEALGTAFLLMIVIGSGVMGERLAGGNDSMVPCGARLVPLLPVVVHVKSGSGGLNLTAKKATENVN